MTQQPVIPPEENPPDKVIFVGGAPRSGTSVTQALLCTAQAVNRYHPEISYVRPILESYGVGMSHWQAHTRGFFRKPEHFKLHMRNLVTTQLTYIARVLNYPRVLCVKDPLLTPYFPMMREVLGWPSQYVTVLRHPHSVVRSLQEVVKRGGNEFDEELILFAANDYLNSYAHIDDPEMQDVLMCLRYEDLSEAETIKTLREFTGLPGISPSNVWKGEHHQSTAEEQEDPWYSPKYYSAIDTSSRLSPLAPHIRNMVNDVCGEVMEKYGYLPDGSHS